MSNRKLKFFALPVLGAVLCCASAAASDAPSPSDGFHCVVTPSQTVELGTPIPGQLYEVLVDRADEVTAGQIVASLDSRLEAANLEIARFRAATDTRVHLRQAAFAIDRRTEKRLSSLVASKVASAQEKDRAARQSRLSAWEVRQAKDDLELYALEMARAEAEEILETTFRTGHQEHIYLEPNGMLATPRSGGGIVRLEDGALSWI